MKNLSFILVAFFILTGISFAGGRTPEKMTDESFKKSAGWAKMDIRLKDAWSKAAASPSDTGKDVVFDCLLKTRAETSKDERSVLKSAGFNARTFVGQIITGSVSARALPRVANLSFVTVIELAAPLSPKK